MAHGPRYRVPFRRRREGRTNYRKRRALLFSNKPRMVVRNSSKYVRVQFVSFDSKGDKVEVSAFSRELSNYGWTGSGKSIPAAYLTGYLAGKRALKMGHEEAVLDIGTATPHAGGRIFSAMKGASEAGVEIPHSEDAAPDENRLSGSHIDEKMPELVEKVKSQIDSMKED